jgi:hypothetical protein
MTQSEFIKMYCENSNITEEQLQKFGQFAFPCHCEEEGCEGWQMGSNDSVMHEVAMKRIKWSS